MTNPFCPGCGKLMYAQTMPIPFISIRNYRMVCDCGWAGPLAATEEAAREAAARRYVEPNRVLTLEETAVILEAKLPVFLECEGMADGMWITNGDQMYSELTLQIEESSQARYTPQRWDALYNKNRWWRCWLRRPTDEERAAAKWGEKDE